jgi:hypothetical protein
MYSVDCHLHYRSSPAGLQIFPWRPNEPNRVTLEETGASVSDGERRFCDHEQDRRAAIAATGQFWREHPTGLVAPSR